LIIEKKMLNAAFRHWEDFSEFGQEREIMSTSITSVMFSFVVSCEHLTPGNLHNKKCTLAELDIHTMEIGNGAEDLIYFAQFRNFRVCNRMDNTYTTWVPHWLSVK
jgi:hypothetical protein